MNKLIDITVNKYPFWLFWTYDTKVELDEINYLVKSTNIDKKSHYIKAKNWEILALKYIPVLILLFVVRIPKSLQDAVILLAALVLSGLSVYVYNKFYGFFKTYLVSTIITMLIIFLYFNGIGRYLNILISYLFTIYIIVFLIYDYLTKDFRKYYYLADVQNIGKIIVAKKTKQNVFKIPFFKKYLINNKNIGLDLFLNYRFGGYYFYTNENLEDFFGDAK